MSGATKFDDGACEIEVEVYAGRVGLWARDLRDGEEVMLSLSPNEAEELREAIANAMHKAREFTIRAAREG